MNIFAITDDQYIDEMEFDFAPWTEVDEVDLGTQLIIINDYKKE